MMMCVLALALTISGCGGTATTPTTAATAQPTAPATQPTAATQAQTIAIKLKSFAIEPSALTAKAGAIQFDVANTASDIKHEFVVIKLDKTAAELPFDATAAKVDEERVTSPGEVDELDPGAKGSVTLTLEPGNYAFICN